MTMIRQYANSGSVCIESLGSRQAEQRVHVSVVFPTCVSSSCDTALEPSCSVVLKGTSLRVESSAKVRSLGGKHACTHDCRFLTAECESPVLPPGEYTISY